MMTILMAALVGTNVWLGIYTLTKSISGGFNLGVAAFVFTGYIGILLERL